MPWYDIDEGKQIELFESYIKPSSIFGVIDEVEKEDQEASEEYWTKRSAFEL